MLLLVGACVACEGDARKLIESDDFTGTDDSLPDSAKWTLVDTAGDDDFRLVSNTVRMTCTADHWPRIQSRNAFGANEITATTEWKCQGFSMNPLVFGVRTYRASSWDWGALVSYDSNRGWYLCSYDGSTVNYHASNLKTLVTGVWYEINLTVRFDAIDASIFRTDTGTTIWTWYDVATDALGGNNRMALGTRYSDVYYDNFELYDDNPPENMPPRWLPLSQFNAVEDVPKTVDFTSYVYDPDGSLSELHITSDSPYVTGTSGLSVTFLFPNGVLDVGVPLVLNDLWDGVSGLANFTVEPVNDPPTHDIPTTFQAMEDVPKTIDLSPYVHDEDNATCDLFVATTDPYATTDGLSITVTFPEGLGSHDLYLIVSDGLLYTTAVIRFSILKGNNGPMVLELPNLRATEGQVLVFNMTEYIVDADTPLEYITVLAFDPNCTVHGMELHFCYHVGDVTHNVNLDVSDGVSHVGAVLVVYVENVNDPPRVAGISPKLFTEDEAKTIDLAPYITDEDNDPEDIVILCDHHAVTAIEGHTITFLYTTYEPQHVITFEVFDGIARDEGSFEVQVKAMNDPPVVLGLRDLDAPFDIEVDERRVRWFNIIATDEEQTTFEYRVEADWGGIEAFSNGTIRVTGWGADVGRHAVTLVVDDRNGGIGRLVINVTVRNVNDPPMAPTIVYPVNHSIVVEGDNVTFAVDVDDPDLVHGDVLEVTWISNDTGVIKSLTSDVDLEFSYGELPRGLHRITVSVTDGEFTRSVWFEIEVIKRASPPPPDDGEGFLSGAAAIAAILGAIVLAIVVVALVAMSRRGKPSAPVTTPYREIPRPTEGPKAIEVTDAHHMGLQSLIPTYTGTLDQDETPTVPAAPDTVEGVQATPEPEAPEAPEALEIPEAETEVTEEVRAQREHDRTVREVMRTLTQLPGGLPTTLWGKDMSRLAKEIVDGPKRTTDDGTLLVEIDGRWYTADHKNVGRFLHELKEERPRKRSTSTTDDRTRKLEQLEERLLEGKISEETYERLRKKYEGE